ncbi:MAG: hypothetical protein JNL98_01255 [Bryobacterales bacterium]|nr:hypothetical protein [Bryobacterales bacterium]
MFSASVGRCTRGSFAWWRYLCAASIAAVFAAAAFDQLTHSTAGVNALRTLVWLPSDWEPAAFWLLTAAEGVIAMGLLVPTWQRGALYAGGLLVGGFALLQVGNLVNIPAASCGARFSPFLLRYPSARDVLFLLSVSAFLLLIAESFRRVAEPGNVRQEAVTAHAETVST